MVFGLPYAASVKALVAGTYGYGNFGGDCYVDILRSRMSGYDLDILTPSGEADLPVQSYDAAILAGGGLLYQWVSDAGAESLKHYLRYPAIAQWLGKKSFLIGAGAQGPILPQNFGPYLNVFESMNLNTVRDSFSARLMREAGIGSVLECTDLFYSKSIYPDLKRRACPNPGKPVLGVVVSQPAKGILHPEFVGFEERIQQALRILEKDFRLHFFSFDNRTDQWLAESWNGDYLLSRFDTSGPDGVSDSINRFIESFKTVDAFVTTRFSGVVISILTGTPFVGIGAPSEKIQRELEAIRYPVFRSYVSTTNQFVESVREMWSERQELTQLLQHAATQRKKFSQRNFDLMDSEIAFPERNGARMISQIAATIRKSSSFRTLVVWAAGPECWSEAAGLFSRLRNVDCLLPPQSPLRHTAIDQRILLSEPGIFNWEAFPDELRSRLALQYDNVIVCHSAAPGKVTDLRAIAAACGHRVWEFNVWSHSIHLVGESETAIQCEQVLRSEGVPA